MGNNKAVYRQGSLMPKVRKDSDSMNKEKPFRDAELEELYQKMMKSIRGSGCKIKLT
jgi:hypothetical protein